MGSADGGGTYGDLAWYPTAFPVGVRVTPKGSAVSRPCPVCDVLVVTSNFFDDDVLFASVADDCFFRAGVVELEVLFDVDDVATI